MDNIGQNALREGRAWRYLIAKKAATSVELAKAAWGDGGIPPYINAQSFGVKIGYALCALGKARKSVDGFELRAR